MNYLYLLVDLGAISVPFAFSFHPKIRFAATWNRAWPAILLSALPFLAWDMIFTEKGVWGFNPEYTIGAHVINLPVEEVLFFICIPYACLFTYSVLGKLSGFSLSPKAELPVTAFLCVMLIAVAVTWFDHRYTFITGLTGAVLLLFLKAFVHPSWLGRFYLVYLVLLFPFCIVNGILTGTGLDAPVVWYNAADILGVRISTIPVEDVFYGMTLILLNVAIYEGLRGWGSRRPDRS